MSAQEVRITTAGKVQNYVGYVLSVLDPGHEHDPVGRSCGCGMVQLRAAGPAVNKAVTVAEIVKRRLDGLHQVTTAALQVNEALPCLRISRSRMAQRKLTSKSSSCSHDNRLYRRFAFNSLQVLSNQNRAIVRDPPHKRISHASPGLLRWTAGLHSATILDSDSARHFGVSKARVMTYTYTCTDHMNPEVNKVVSNFKCK